MRTSITFPDLASLAEDMGVTLAHHDRGGKAYYFHDLRLISTRRGMSPAQYKSSLSHELAHAHYEDVPTGLGFFDRRQEARADLWAAKLLIDPDELRDAMVWHQQHLPGAADELEVTQHLLTVWLTHHDRIGSR